MAHAAVLSVEALDGSRHDRMSFDCGVPSLDSYLRSQASQDVRRNLGGALLVRALRKAYENTAVVGSSMVIVDALDGRAADFYAAYGFVRLPESMRLVLPMQAVAALFEASRR